MDSVTRLKTKIGEHEFDAEGSPEYVREQFVAWQELVKLATSAVTATPKESGHAGQEQNQHRSAAPLGEPDLTRIMRIEGRYVSLTARAASVHDAVMLLLYGQKVMRNNDAVTGAEILSGLSTTGGYGDPRLDRIFDKLAMDGDVTSFGERRGKKYRLTNTGIGKVRAIANDLIASVA